MHAASRLACLARSSARSCPSNICPGRLSTAWLFSLVVFSCRIVSKWWRVRSMSMCRLSGGCCALPRTTSLSHIADYGYDVCPLSLTHIIFYDIIYCTVVLQRWSAAFATERFLRIVHSLRRRTASWVKTSSTWCNAVGTKRQTTGQHSHRYVASFGERLAASKYKQHSYAIYNTPKTSYTVMQCVCVCEHAHWCTGIWICTHPHI